MLSSPTSDRYSRQIMLPELGESGQAKLLQSKVLVIGAGGLGCPVLQYLVAAGVGKIGIADDDRVSVTNLHRQVLYGTEDVGKPKGKTAAAKLSALNEEVQIDVLETRITNANAWDIIGQYDLIIDGSDNFPTRYLVNDACVVMGKPLVYGSIFRFEGQVAVFNVDGSANYRDLFPEPPADGEVPDCSEAGVLGVLTGIIGSMMASEAIKLIAGFGIPLTNKLLTYNALQNTFYEIEFTSQNKRNSSVPKSRSEFEMMDYRISCGLNNEVVELGEEEFNAILTFKSAQIIDVREAGEEPFIDDFEHANLPLSDLKKQPGIVNPFNAIVLFCQSGKRSMEAARIIKANNPEQKEIYSLKGGIAQWKKNNRRHLHEQ